MNIQRELEDAVLKTTASSFCGKIVRKIYAWFLNTCIAERDEYYSYQEPPKRKMKKKNYWIQIINTEEE